MSKAGFREYMNVVTPKNSGTSASYVMAISILDEIFKKQDVLGLNGTSLFSIDDEALLLKIREFVKAQEKLMKQGAKSIFVYGNPNQTSYPKKGFCSAAVGGLIKYICNEKKIVVADAKVQTQNTGKGVSTVLIEHFHLDKVGKDKVSAIKMRLGQSYFRKMVLENYQNKCCVTGLNVPIVLRASHIVEWAKDKENRMNPENGLCLSATYDAAFDRHLISFDDDFRMIISKEIKDYYTAQVTRDYFEAFEGKKILMPVKYAPSKKLLAKHRDLLVG